MSLWLANQSVKSPESKWVWWAWPVLLAFLILVSYASFYLRNFTDSALLYLPTPFAIVLLYWYGPRVLPLIYINEIVTLVLWGAPGGWLRITILALHAPVTAFASWFLFKKTNDESEKQLLGTTNLFIRFTLFGVCAPLLINSLFINQYTFVNHDLYIVLLIFLADFLSILTIATPVLYFLAPDESKFGIKLTRPHGSQTIRASGSPVSEFWLIVAGFVIMIFFIDFDVYWYIYGVASIMVGIRRGFPTVILVNAIIFILNYILPLLDVFDFALASEGSTKLANVHLGMLTMIISSSLIGRVVSDLWKTEYKLTEQKIEAEKANEQLVKINAELDRFVYSLSHDISAPLKSIKGLVNLSRLENSPEQSTLYLSKIDSSINRLESFITEVLDYSRTNRKELVQEEVLLSPIIREIIDDLRYLDNLNTIEFDIKLKKESIHSDRFLIKVILANLISNAIKYQKSDTGHKPYIRISSEVVNHDTKIRIEDNGEGISPHSKEKIFEMFYRGSSTSTGSGLGLYILKEAVEKLNGQIEIISELDRGSTFIISIPSSA